MHDVCPDISPSSHIYIYIYILYIYIHLCITCIDTNVSVHTVKRMPEDTYLWRKALPHGKKALHQLPAKWGESPTWPQVLLKP